MARGHPPPELTVNDLKQMFIDQDGKCAVLGEKMKEKHGDSSL